MRANEAALTSAVNRRRRASGIDLGQRHLGIGDAQQVIEAAASPRGLRREPGAHLRTSGLRRRDRSTPVAARSSRATTWKGTSLACDSQKAVNTSTPRGGGHRRDLAHQTALADARWAHHADHRAVAVDGAVQQALDGGHLPAPTDQSRLSTPDSAMPVSGTPSSRWAAPVRRRP